MQRTYTIIIVTAVIVFSVAIGFYFGEQRGKTIGDAAARGALIPLVERAYSKPPAELFELTGTIVGIYGATMHLEVVDPDDYLPHLDGSAPRTNTRYASLAKTTKVVRIDLTKRDANGNPTITTLDRAVLKVGDRITVKSTANIRDAETFDTVEVQLVEYGS
jgi:hypothetical protein